MEQRKNSSSFIYSYLPFSDDRIQFLDIRGWDGQAIKLNREFYIDFLRNKRIFYSNFSEEKRNDIKNEIIERTEDVDGIYILLGDDMESNMTEFVILVKQAILKEECLNILEE